LNASIWKTARTPEELNRGHEHTMIDHIGIEVLEVGADFLRARMPVDARTHQPYGLLHGGASVALAETVGSLASMLCIDPDKNRCVGLDINANHLRGVRSGWVYATARPVHIGARTHVWAIDIKDEADKKVCVSRLTMAIIAKDSNR
jgi:1,4-dihydroxy-2-naphthoyl-CoA hydrolase